MQRDSSIKFVHYLRAIGTLCVIYGHWGIVFFLYPDRCSHLGLYKDFVREQIPFLVGITSFEFFNFGYFGVGLFFLISGFLTNISWKNKSIGSFEIKRALRLYPLYLVGLLFTGGILLLSAMINGIEYPYTWDIFLKNWSLCRLWFWAPSIDGVNWTMEVDVFFYLVCIVLVYFGYKLNDIRIYVVLSMVGAIFIYWAFNINISLIKSQLYLYKFCYCVSHFFSYLPIIFIGMLLWNAKSGEESIYKTVVCILVLYLFFCFDYSILRPEVFKTFWFSYGCSIGIFTFGYYIRERIENISCPLLDYIGRISFPLYVIHGAAGYALLAWLYKCGLELLSFLIAGIIFVGLAHLLHKFVELKVEELARRWIG